MYRRSGEKRRGERKGGKDVDMYTLQHYDVRFIDRDEDRDGGGKREGKEERGKRERERKFKVGRKVREENGAGLDPGINDTE